MKKLKSVLALLLCFVLIFSLAACGGSDDAGTKDTGSKDTGTKDTGSAGTATDGGSEDEYHVFRFGGDANNTSFNPPVDINTTSSTMMVAAVCETMWIDNNDGTYTPNLCSYEFADDDSSITIRCIEGVVFSNGSAFASDDVLFTLTNMRDAGRTASMVASLDLDNAVIVDDYTVEIPLLRYDAAFLAYMASPAYCVIDKQTHEEEDPDWAWIVGTGPYYLAEWEEAVKYVLKVNENYRGEKPYYDEIQICFYSEEATRYSEFQAGNLDAIIVTESSYINNLGAGKVDGASLTQVVSPSVNGLTLAYDAEHTNGAFADINLRLALAHCIDVETIVNELGEGVYAIPKGIVTEDCFAFEEGYGCYEYDVDLAKEYLAKAGYSVDNPVTVYMYAENTAWNTALCEAIQSYAMAIGINFDLTNVSDFPTILPALLAGENDMSINSPSSSAGTDPANELQQAGPLSDNSLLRTYDEELGEIFDRASASHDIETRKQLYHEFIEGYHAQVNFIPLYQSIVSYAYRDEHASFVDSIYRNQPLLFAITD